MLLHAFDVIEMKILCKILRFKLLFCTDLLFCDLLLGRERYSLCYFFLHISSDEMSVNVSASLRLF